MRTTQVRQVSDGEELVIEEVVGPYGSHTDPREAGFDRRDQAIADGQPADPRETSSRSPRK